MPTFLVNAKMHPELAARVEASVTGGRRVRGRPRPGLTALVRVAFFLAVSLFIYVVATTRKPDPPQLRGGPKPAPVRPVASVP